MTVHIFGGVYVCECTHIECSYGVKMCVCLPSMLFIKCLCHVDGVPMCRSYVVFSAVHACS